MGLMIEGVWHIEEPDDIRADGRYRRGATTFRHWVTADGSAGPSGEGGFAAEAGRYHLYVAINCPWAHRTWIMRRLKGLEDVVGLSLVVPTRTDEGWVFEPEGRFADRLLGTAALHEIYTLARPDYTGRVTVPVLFDRERRTIVNNESAEIIRMLNGAFQALAKDRTDFHPAELGAEIDAIDDRIYRTLNNGVYRAGFARTQEAYEEAFDEVFATLDWLEERLGGHRYLLGDRLTEADIRLFPTLIRFDVAYHGAFKCNLKRLIDYPNLWAYTRELYQWPGIAETVDLEVYKRGYYSRSALRNPLGTVPKGPLIDLGEPHGRERLRARAA
jgi:putative glutathione S-transferase